MLYTFQARSRTVAYAGIRRGRTFFSCSKIFSKKHVQKFCAYRTYALYDKQMYGTHTLAFQRIFVRMKIISLIFIRFSYVSLIRNSVTGP
jgi:hypothetical protein